MKSFKNLFVFFLIVSLSCLASASDIYVSQNGAGSVNGADAADANSLAWLNNAVNWGTGSSQVKPGDTVHLVGTFTSALNVAGNGAANNPVTIYFEPGVNFSSPCWSTFGAIVFNNNFWVTVDGGVNGMIQNTANGTGLANRLNSRGLAGTLNYCVVKNLTITNIYNNIQGSGDINRLGYPVDIVGNFITISNCNFSDGDALLSYSGTTGANSTNIFIVNNRFLNFNHAMFIGTGDNNSMVTNLVISGNLMDRSDVWDVANSGRHLDDIIIANNTDALTTCLSGVYIFQNVFGPHFGKNNTAGIYNGLSNYERQMLNCYVYNNLFLAYSNSWGNGCIGMGGSNVWVVNNTCYGLSPSGAYVGGGIGIAGSNSYCYNNIMMSGSGINLGAYTEDTTASGAITGPNNLKILTTYFQTTWSDHNVIAGTASPNFGLGLALFTPTAGQGGLWVLGAAFGSLHDWQTYYNNEYGPGGPYDCGCGWTLPIWNNLHCDPNSTTNMPVMTPGTVGNFNLNYMPAGNDTVAVGKGTNLSFLGITNDFFGHPRPAVGNWTIGAFEVTSSTTPAAGVSLTASTNGSGQTVLTWATANATSLTISGLGAVGLSGTATVTVTGTTTYTAVATGPGGSGSQSVTVSPVTVVTTPAATVSLIASTNNNQITLTWTTANATSLTISGLGAENLSGSANVSVSSTTTFTANATGPGAPGTASVTVSPVALPPQATVSISASTNSNNQIVLSWNTANATGLSISGLGNEPLSGSTIVTVTGATLFSAEATGTGGSGSASVTVTPPSAPTVTIPARPPTPADFHVIPKP